MSQSRVILFVCTGNTCRSPMAESLFRMMLPQGTMWRAASAGLAARPGLPASPEAIQVLAEAGAELRQHGSRPVTHDLIRDAYAVIAMTPSQADQLAWRFPPVQDRLFLLRAFDPDVPQPAAIDDPFGGTLDDYRRCRDIIREAVRGLIIYLNKTA
ncbi:MAG TPA: low molecular weight protein arginine phosphatase [Kiritimatiellia bacterium]|nr:low molecular weight protein arginine phosphatase [Kiritimatiellia bacterium]HRU71251.1 low molecular weight protein arginine phosphatase [Kiritimatiellia bacterium]